MTRYEIPLRRQSSRLGDLSLVVQTPEHLLDGSKLYVETGGIGLREQRETDDHLVALYRGAVPAVVETVASVLATEVGTAEFDVTPRDV